jgi:hypothetical protein
MSKSLLMIMAPVKEAITNSCRYFNERRASSVSFLRMMLHNRS